MKKQTLPRKKEQAKKPLRIAPIKKAPAEKITPTPDYSKPREILEHRVEGGGVPLQILALGAPGNGGAPLTYEINGYPGDPLTLNFQQGDPRERITGITTEALLAVCIDRQRAFDLGPFPSADGRKALDHMINALRALQRRTKARLKRGVEGKNVK